MIFYKYGFRYGLRAVQGRYIYLYLDSAPNAASNVFVDETNVIYQVLIRPRPLPRLLVFLTQTTVFWQVAEGVILLGC